MLKLLFYPLAAIGVGLAIGGLLTLAGCNPSSPENVARAAEANRTNAQYIVDNLQHVRDAQGRCYAVMGSSPQYAVLTWEPCQ